MPVTELNSVVALAFGGFGCWLFAAAAAHKIADFPRFSATLGAYQLAPPALTGVLAGLVVALEVMAAVMLFLVFLVPMVVPTFVLNLGVEAGSLPVLSLALLAPLLMLGYAAAMALNLLRGRRSIDCGCGDTPMPLSKALVVRNLFLGAALIWALMIIPTNSLVQSTQPVFDGWLLLVVLGCSLVLCFIYLIVNQLLANRALHEQLWVQH